MLSHVDHEPWNPTSPGAQTRIEYDHKHKGERVRFYLYADASAVLNDFWQEVELILQERGP